MAAGGAPAVDISESISLLHQKLDLLLQCTCPSEKAAWLEYIRTLPRRAEGVNAMSRGRKLFTAQRLRNQDRGSYNAFVEGFRDRYGYTNNVRERYAAHGVNIAERRTRRNRKGRRSTRKH